MFFQAFVLGMGRRELAAGSEAALSTSHYPD